MLNPKDAERRTDALNCIARERERQDAKWGEQNHPDGTSCDIRSVKAAQVTREQCQAAAEGGYITWRHILAEEVAEAFAEEDLESLADELIQVAAVATAWVESIYRRQDAAVAAARALVDRRKRAADDSDGQVT